MDNQEILKSVKKMVVDREKERHKEDMRIFYPDPCNGNDCAVCGKSKYNHQLGPDKKPFFCKSETEQKWKTTEQLGDEIALEYADAITKSLQDKLIYAEIVIDTCRPAIKGIRAGIHWQNEFKEAYEIGKTDAQLISNAFEMIEDYNKKTRWK